jgi:hypothetical protein
MRRGLHIACGVAAISAAILLSGCGIDVQVRKSAVGSGDATLVTARVKAPAGTMVQFKMTDGGECGMLSGDSAATSAGGVASVTFTGAAGVDDCAVTIEASTGAALSGKTSFYVNKQPLTKAKIDGISILVLFAIASFAIDRTVRGLMFGLGFFAFWRRWVPEAASAAEESAANKKQQLAYVALAGALSIVVLGWFAKVRVLAALGFAQVHPIVDTLFTGMLMIGGAERTEALLRAMGAGAGSEAAKDAAPLEIRGRIVLEDSTAKEGGGTAVHGPHA